MHAVDRGVPSLTPRLWRLCFVCSGRWADRLESQLDLLQLIEDAEVNEVLTGVYDTAAQRTAGVWFCLCDSPRALLGSRAQVLLHLHRHRAAGHAVRVHSTPAE